MTMPESRTLEFVAACDTTQRLDVWLAAQIKDMSRAQIQALIRAGYVTVDGVIPREHRRLKAGQTARIFIPPPTPIGLVPENIPLEIIYQDGDIIVVNKPAGMVTHPAAGHPQGTLANALLYHCPDIAGIGCEMRPGIVHRLDRDTSGLIVAAKNSHALQCLANQFKQRQVRKEYLALVRGVPPEEGFIDKPIGRHPTQRKKMAVTEKGRAARTGFRRLAVYSNKAALVKLYLQTGRTHQIRVHMALLGHPILGDTVYGRHTTTQLSGMPARQMLHAAKLGFTHPTSGQYLEFTIPLPADMLSFIRCLRTDCNA